MAIDNSLYDSLEDTYFKIKDYFDKVQLTREHSEMIVKHEELAHLLETLDIEALEEQSTDIHSLHKELNLLKEISDKLTQSLLDEPNSTDIVAKVVNGLAEIFSQIQLIKNNL